MELKADFFRDWVNTLKGILVNEWRYDVSSVPESKIPYLYFNAEKRRPEKKVRKLFLADSFVCSPELEDGWRALKDRVEGGEDLSPNLSKLIEDLSDTDPMLNDWGVYHFHLGKEMHGKFVNRTGPLLFALLVDDAFYAIGIFAHGSWANQGIVEIIHRNWPTVIERDKVRGDISPTQLTQKQRGGLRKSGGNAMVTVSDGTSYFPIGGGFAGSGFNLQACIEIDRKRILLRDLERLVANQLESWIGTFEKPGYKGESEIEASLSIEEADYIVTFPKYGFSATYELK